MCVKEKKQHVNVPVTIVSTVRGTSLINQDDETFFTFQNPYCSTKAGSCYLPSCMVKEISLRVVKRSGQGHVLVIRRCWDPGWDESGS